MSNLSIFESQTAAIFAILYESFPVKRDIYRHQAMKDLIPNDGFGEKLLPPDSESEFHEYYSSFDDYSQSPEYLNEALVFKATAEWLKSTGYISYSGMRAWFCIEDAVLTAKGLEVLRCVPSCIDGSLTIGETLQQETINTGSDIAKEAIKQALKEGVKLLASYT